MIQRLLVFLCTSFLCVLAGIENNYPWDSNYETRNEELLSSLRDDLYLDISDSEYVNDLFAQYEAASIRNVDGEIYICSIRNEELSTKSIADSKGEQFKDTLRALKGVCTVVHLGWWNYEWCHRKEVSQFHYEVINGVGVRKPQWSLGKFTHSTIIRDHDDDDGDIQMIIDHYVGGQHCDETDEQRSTEVRFQCCSDANPDKRVTKVLNVVEQELCKYRVDVCTAALCDESELVTPTLSGVMTSLSSQCLHLQEPWWTYEICFAQGIRQFRMSTVATADQDDTITQTKTLEAQHMLGSAPVHLFNNESALQERVVSVKSSIALAKHSKPAKLVLEYEGGSECDIEDVVRGTSVEITCGERNALNDVIEDSTCHYILRVTSTDICHIDEFREAHLNITKIVCESESSLNDGSSKPKVLAVE